MMIRDRVPESRELAYSFLVDHDQEERYIIWRET